jgi:hypothetical protein
MVVIKRYMPLKPNMTNTEIEEYLGHDLKVSIINDIKPCLLGEGGYFSVPRLVLSYVDYLGALFHGYKHPEQTKQRLFAKHTYAKRFLKYIFGLLDSNYCYYGDLLWEIYRNGTVHLYEPLTLQNSGQRITWVTYKGERENAFLPVPYEVEVTHLVPLYFRNHIWIQPISIDCLYLDLVSAIDLLAEIISKDSNLSLIFRNTANALQEATPTSLKWWQITKSE